MSRASQFLTRLEARPTERTLYFGSSTQNLHRLAPRLPATSHSQYIEKRPTLYATDDKSYASAFTFPWSEREGFEFGKFGRRGHYILKVPYRFLSRLEEPCSIYTVTGHYSRLPIAPPEYVTHDSVRIVKEEQYSTVSECMKKNGVLVHVIQVKRKISPSRLSSSRR